MRVLVLMFFALTISSDTFSYCSECNFYRSHGSGSIGFIDGVIAIVGFAAMVGAGRGLLVLLSESTGWRKIIPIALLVGFFILNEASKSIDNSREIHMLLVVFYIGLAMYFGFKLNKYNKKCRQVRSEV